MVPFREKNKEAEERNLRQELSRMSLKTGTDQGEVEKTREGQKAEEEKAWKAYVSREEEFLYNHYRVLQEE